MTAVFASLLALLLASSTPIFIALAGTVLVMAFLSGSIPPAILVQTMFAGIDNFALMAIPFFILTGLLMSVGGLSRRIRPKWPILRHPIPGPAWRSRPRSPCPPRVPP